MKGPITTIFFYSIFVGSSAIAGLENPFPLNQVACLDSTPKHVQNIINEAKKSKGVILYFHGGLSDRKYMENELGPWLMDSIFKKDNRRDLYPIFVNYDAGIDLETLKRFLAKIDILKAAEDIQHAIETEIAKEDFKSSETKAEDYANAAKVILDGGVRKLTRKDEDYAKIVLDRNRQVTVAETVKDYSPDLVSATKEIEKEILRRADEKGMKTLEVQNITNPATVIIRVLARTAIQTNHEVVPTVLEELLRELNLIGIEPDKFAQAHWEKVYEHGEECWKRDNNGRRLIDALFRHQQEVQSNGGRFTINTMSHSAGSITTAYLINYAAKNKHKLDVIVMVVPALNQELFKKNVIKNHDVIGALRLFVLEQQSEEDDKLVGGVYPASLLYFVSGVAESKGFGDRLLMLNQHLDSQKYPYNTKWYPIVFGENPSRVWKYLAEKPGTLTYYGESFQPVDRHPNGDTHTCTKYPWDTRDLARSIISILTNDPQNQPLLEPPPNDADLCE